MHQQDSETVREHHLILYLIVTAEVNRCGNERCGDILYNYIITALYVPIFPVDFVLLQSYAMIASHLNHQNLEKKAITFYCGSRNEYFHLCLNPTCSELVPA